MRFSEKIRNPLGKWEKCNFLFPLYSLKDTLNNFKRASRCSRDANINKTLPNICIYFEGRINVWCQIIFIILACGDLHHFDLIIYVPGRGIKLITKKTLGFFIVYYI